MKFIFELGQEEKISIIRCKIEILRIRVRILKISEDQLFELSGKLAKRAIEPKKTESKMSKRMKIEPQRFLKIIRTAFKILELADIKNYKIRVEANYQMLDEPGIISALGIIQILPNTQIVLSEKSSIKIAISLKFTKMIKLILLLIKERLRMR